MSNVSTNCVVLGPIEIGVASKIHSGVIIGFKNAYDDIFSTDADRIVRIGDNCELYPWSLLYEGATLEDRVIVHERCTIGSRTRIGSRSRLVYGAQVHDNVVVGADCIVGGFVADNCSIGGGSSIFGALVHRYDQRSGSDWDSTDERGPRVGVGVLVGWGAVLVGDISVGNGARIGPNCVVTTNVAAGERRVSH